MKKVNVVVTAFVQIEVPDYFSNDEIDHILDELDYNFKDTTGYAEVTHMRLDDFEIMDNDDDY